MEDKTGIVSEKEQVMGIIHGEMRMTTMGENLHFHHQV